MSADDLKREGQDSAAAGGCLSDPQFVPRGREELRIAKQEAVAYRITMGKGQSRKNGRSIVSDHSDRVLVGGRRFHGDQK